MIGYKKRRVRDDLVKAADCADLLGFSRVEGRGEKIPS